MKNRCYTTGTPYYKNYGGRGITVCEDWRNSYPAFLRDVGRRPGPSYTLDRIDNDGDYRPGNVRWVTRDVQNGNQRCSGSPLTLNGITKRMEDWATEYGVKKRTIIARLAYGWTVERAITTPARQWGR